MSFDILNRWTGAVLFSSATADDIAAAVKEAHLGRKSLRDADLSGAVLRDAVLSGADLRGADLRGDGAGIPKVENIHGKVYEAASKPNALDMGSWHACKTTHCRAGWVVTLAGPGGAALEWALGTPVAAALIYQKSDPTLEKIPDFYCGNSEALEDMKRMADAEAARAAK